MNEDINSILMKVFDLQNEDVIKDLSREEIAKWDSLTHMDLVVTLENEFDIELDIDDIISMKSLNEIRGVMKKFGVE